MKKLARFIALLFLLVSCNKTIPDEVAVGDGNVTLRVGIDSGIEVVSRASSTEEVSGDYKISITDQDDLVKSEGVYSDYSVAFKISAYSGYKISAESISDAEAIDGRGALRFYGASEFDVAVGYNTSVSFVCSATNSRVSVDYTDDFKTMFSKAEVSVWESSSEDRVIIYDYSSDSTTESYWGYFNIDSDPEITVKVNATLNSGDTREYSTTVSIAKATWQKLSVHSSYVGGQSALDIVVDTDILTTDEQLGLSSFQELEITVPEQVETDVWATFFYPTAATLDNISDVDNKDIILQNLVYEVSADATAEQVATYNSGGTWIAATSVDGTLMFSGLTPNTKYTMRARYYNMVSQNSCSFTTESDAQVSNAGFEDWSTVTVTHWPTVFGSYSRNSYNPYLTTSGYDVWWDTNNAQTTSEMGTISNQNYKFFPAVSYTTGRSGSYAAQICAMAYGGDLTTSSTTYGTKVPGKLLIGSINSSGSITSTGHSFTSRPTSMDFWYKYEIYDGTSFSAYVEVLNGTTVIATGEFIGSASATSWTQASVDLTYSVTNKKATSIYIKLQSTTTESPSVRAASITVPEGTYTIWKGSLLVVDDINLNY